MFDDQPLAILRALRARAAYMSLPLSSPFEETALRAYEGALDELTARESATFGAIRGVLNAVERFATECWYATSGED